MADDTSNYWDMLSPALGLGLGGYGVYNQYNLGNQAEKGMQGAVNAAQPFQYQGVSPGYAASQTAGKQGMEDYYAQMGLGTSGAMAKAEYDYGQQGVYNDYQKQLGQYNQDRNAMTGALTNQGKFYGLAAGQGAGQNPFSGATSANNASQYAALIKQIYGAAGGGSQPGITNDPSASTVQGNMFANAQGSEVQGGFGAPQGYQDYGQSGGSWGEPQNFYGGNDFGGNTDYGFSDFGSF